jgi:hypothetical protein
MNQLLKVWLKHLIHMLSIKIKEQVMLKLNKKKMMIIQLVTMITTVSFLSTRSDKILNDKPKIHSIKYLIFHISK